MATHRSLLSVASLAASLLAASSVRAEASVPAPASCNTYSTALIAGQNIDIGDVVVTRTASEICVAFDISAPGWRAVETHVAIVTDVADFPMTSGGSPQIGLFPDSGTDLVYCVDLATLGCTAGTDLYIAAHASVERDVNDCVQQETAWGQGPGFASRDWAMYFRFELASCPPPPPACAADEVYNQTTNTCDPRCAADQLWNAGSNRCEARCADDELWNAETSECVSRCTCDEIWNPATATCDAPECLSGTIWNPESHACEKPSCPADKAWNAETATCETLCAAGETLDAASDTCVPVVIECDADSYFSAADNACVLVSVTGGGCSASGSSSGAFAAFLVLCLALGLRRRRQSA